MTKKWKVCVIGGGAIAQRSHIPGYTANPDFELTAIAEPCEASLAMVRNKWKFGKEYSDYREMLKNEKPDVVSVCTPNIFHAEMAIAALESGADLVLEKPIALSITDGEAIRAAGKRTGKRIFICFSHRFNDFIIATRKALMANLIGKPYMIRVRFAHCGPWPGWAQTDWFYNPEMAGGGALLDMAVHAFDLVRHLTGEVTAISAKAATLRKNIKVDDNVVALLEIGNDCMGYVEAGWTSPAGFLGVEVMGDKGCVTADYGSGKVVAKSGSLKPDGTNEIVSSVLQDTCRPHWQCQMAEITHRLVVGEEPSPGIEDGIKALEITLAAYESSRTGRRMELK